MKRITIEDVTKMDISQYFRLGRTIYETDPFLKNIWSRPLLAFIKRSMVSRRNPFWKHAVRVGFVAKLDSRVVGCITGVINHAYNKKKAEKVGFWSYFESINNKYVSKSLFNSIEKWVQQQGGSRMYGPVYPSYFEIEGLLTKGYKHSPNIFMPYNPPYYANLCEAHGNIAVTRKISWVVKASESENLRHKINRIEEAICRRENFSIRSMDNKNKEKDFEIMRVIFKDSLQNRWGFFPVSKEEIKEFSKLLRKVADKRFVFFALDSNNQEIAVSIALPSLEHVLKKMKGRLYSPLSFFYFLLGKRRSAGCQIMILSTRGDGNYQGVDALLYVKTLKEVIAKKKHYIELGLREDESVTMERLARSIEVVPQKEYTVYEKKI